jgi:hypothetical protein
LIATLFLLATTAAIAGAPDAASVRIAILGNPERQVAWTDEAMGVLEAIGFNEVQLNVAWSSKPFGEALNLVDVVTVPGEAELPGTAERRLELKRRVELAKKHGLRVLFHFGSPCVDYDPYLSSVRSGHVDDATFDSWYDISNPKVRGHELDLLREFRRQFPEVDDILVYTYDQNAWQTPEFQINGFSYGVPLSVRLTAYLKELHHIWTDGRIAKARMWWEPWELSAGQVYGILPELPRSGFGLIIHSNIAEAQLALPVDVWFRNTARMCRTLGIPVVAESFFASATEEIAPLSIPAPRLVDEEYLAFMGVPGVVGFKEYYGIDTSVPDLDIDLLKARLRDPSGSTDELIDDITRRFGGAQANVRAYLELISDALRVYPWDASWSAREVGRASTDHGWSGATIQGAAWSTPSWQATRHAKFMKTDDAQPHFWMLEDVELRCRLAAEILDRAGVLAARLFNALPDPADRAQFRRIQFDVDVFRRVSRSYALHIRETNVAQMLRQDLAAGRPMTVALTKELGELIDSDSANQNGQGRVVEMRRLYAESPEGFVRRYLIPVDGTPEEKGPFTLTTR